MITYSFYQKMVKPPKFINKITEKISEETQNSTVLYYLERLENLFTIEYISRDSNHFALLRGVSDVRTS